MFCKQCGAPLSEGARFCESCGTAVTVPEVPRAAVTEPAPVPEPAPIETPQPAQVETPAPAPAPAPLKAEKAPKEKKAKKEKPAKVKKEKSKKKGKKAWIIAPIAAVVALGIGGGSFYFLNNKTKTEKAKDSYSDLCDMTTLGAQSYLYARILTERLLETDLATADPDETQALFKECIDAWEETEGVSEDMIAMSDEIKDSDDMKILASINSRNFLTDTIFGRTAYAASNSSEDDIAETLSVEDSIDQCAALGEQISIDTTICSSKIVQLQEIYDGRNTDYAAWSTQVEQISVCFTNTVFLSGEVVDGDATILENGEPRSVYQISTDPKPSVTTIENTDILIDVGSNSSTFVMSSSDSVTIDQDQISQYISSGSSSTISISTHTKTTEEVNITFHSTSFTTWYILEEVGGYTISRGDKDDDGLFEQPEVEEGDIEPDPVCCPIYDWEPPIGATDIIATRNRINGDRVDIDDTETDISSDDLDEQRELLVAGTGEITVTVIWGTHDDVDLHVITPEDNRIYYANKTADGGTLDIDMNASSSNLSDTPIENIYFPEPMEGHYQVLLRDFRDRTDDMETSYIVRVQIGDDVEEYEGEIDGTGTEILIVEFDYGGYEGDPQPELTEDLLDDLLSQANAGSGDITVSLMWDSWDDVDLHMETPNGEHIYYSNKAADGGILDTDANAGSQRITDPVENIYFAAPSNGHYKVYIHQFNDRTEDSASNYLVRITIGGESQTFTGTIDTTGTDIDILEFDYGGATGIQQTSYVDHTYSYINSNMSWGQARTFAESMGGHLLVINDADEQAFIEQAFPDTYGWIGFVSTSVDWGWINGDPVDYTNVCDTQPNNFDEDTLVGFLYNDMQWAFTYPDDVEYHYGFYIEWDEVLEGAVNGVLSEDLLEDVLTGLNAGSGDITISVLWDSEDDLDLHVFTPDGSEIYYSNKVAQNGELDVDANTSSNMMDNPVENVFFTNPYNGQYWVYLDDYNDRSTGTTNYIVKITIGSESQTFTGTIDGSGTTLEIVGFEYGGGIDEATMDDVLNSLQAGSGEITISMLWDTEDDLDLHVETPDGSEIYYANKIAGGGELDIDANTSSNMMDEPVENIYFETLDGGLYKVSIVDYNDRSSGTTNYIVRVTVGGESQTFTGTIDSSGTTIEIISFNYGGGGSTIPDEDALDARLDSLEAGSGEITVSMLWDSEDDLDLHISTPDGSEIYYGNKVAGGGELDIDANTSSNMMDEPVENVYFSDPDSGTYTIWIENYNDRSSGSTNYIVRVTVGDESETFSGTIDDSGSEVDIISFNY
ncbi:MAG: zinc-ribbon domain-containing protein [Clostridiales bacterium]|nr:zinc-ribbon domain-containing protein [Clostridiales bacterium]